MSDQDGTEGLQRGYSDSVGGKGGIDGNSFGYIGVPGEELSVGIADVALERGGVLAETEAEADGLVEVTALDGIFEVFVDRVGSEVEDVALHDAEGEGVVGELRNEVGPPVEVRLISGKVILQELNPLQMVGVESGSNGDVDMVDVADKVSDEREAYFVGFIGRVDLIGVAVESGEEVVGKDFPDEVGDEFWGIGEAHDSQGFDALVPA